MGESTFVNLKLMTYKGPHFNVIYGISNVHVILWFHMSSWGKDVGWVVCLGALMCEWEVLQGKEESQCRYIIELVISRQLSLIFAAEFWWVE